MSKRVCVPWKSYCADGLLCEGTQVEGPQALMDMPFLAR